MWVNIKKRLSGSTNQKGDEYGSDHDHCGRSRSSGPGESSNLSRHKHYHSVREVVMSKNRIRELSPASRSVTIVRPQSNVSANQQRSLEYSLTVSDYLLIALLWIVTTALRYFLIILLVAGSAGLAIAQPAPSGSAFLPGETLQYKVKWGFFRLGTITITQQQCDSDRSGTSLLTMTVHSSSGLPFINVHFVNKSYKTLRSLWMSQETIISGEDSSEQTTYWEDSATSTLYCSKAGNRMEQSSLDSLHIQGTCYDALGLFMMARLYSASNQVVIVPTLNESAVKETEINFTGESELVEVAALDTPVRCRRVEGNAKWVGNSFAGMKGPFTGWISDDEASIPLRAELKIFLGSIVLELESTNRSDWGPGKMASNQIPHD